MEKERKTPGVGFWCTALALALVAYPLSLGPACWITSRLNAGTTAIPVIYRPMTRAAESSPAVRSAVQGYARLFAADDWVLWGDKQGWKWGRMMASRPNRMPP
jgi:hypothetical protein